MNVNVDRARISSILESSIKLSENKSLHDVKKGLYVKKDLNVPSDDAQTTERRMRNVLIKVLNDSSFSKEEVTALLKIVEGRISKLPKEKNDISLRLFQKIVGGAVQELNAERDLKRKLAGFDAPRFQNVNHNDDDPPICTMYGDSRSQEVNHNGDNLPVHRNNMSSKYSTATRYDDEPSKSVKTELKNPNMYSSNSPSKKKGEVTKMIGHVNAYVSKAGVSEINKSLGFESLQQTEEGISSLKRRDVKKVGAGSFKNVYGSKTHQIALTYLKSIPVTTNDPQETEKIQRHNASVAREIENTQKIFSDPLPNIVRGRVITVESKRSSKAQQTNASGVMISKLANQGTGNKYLETATNEQKRNFFAGAFNGLMGLHSRNLAHEDAHLENFLVHDHEPLLCDFGTVVSTTGVQDLLAINLVMLPPILSKPVIELRTAQEQMKMNRNNLLADLDSAILQHHLSESGALESQEKWLESLPENIATLARKLTNDPELLRKIQILSSDMDVNEEALSHYVTLTDRLHDLESQAALYFSPHVDVYHMGLNILSVCSSKNEQLHFDLNAISPKFQDQQLKNRSFLVLNSILKPDQSEINAQLREGHNIEIDEAKVLAGQKNLEKLIDNVFPKPEGSAPDKYAKIRDLVSKMLVMDLTQQPPESEILAALENLDPES